MSDDTNSPPLHTTLQSSNDEKGTPIARWLVVQRVCKNRKVAADAVVQRQAVKINGETIQSLSKMVQEEDVVEYEQRAIKRRRVEHAYYILHKPPGCISSRQNVVQLKDGSTALDTRPTVNDYIPEEDRAFCNTIGRLDLDTTGLLLFTSDGILHHALASPEFKVEKIYRCVLRKREPLSQECIQQLQDGIKLPHAKGAVVTGKAWNVTDDGVVDLCILGGYKHQVKLMLALVKRPLRLLHRRTFADLELPEDLKEGECRKLTQQEIQHLYSLAKRQMEKQRASVEQSSETSVIDQAESQAQASSVANDGETITQSS